MSYSSNNRNFWYQIISFCIILLLISSCALTTREKYSVSPYILKQYVGSYQLVDAGSYQLGPIAKVTLEGNQLFVSSCPLIGLSISPGTVKKYLDSNRQLSDLEAMLTSEIKLMTRASANKKYPIYARSETVFATKNKLPAQIEFFKNDKGEVTHFILKRKLSDLNNVFLGVEGTGIKIPPYINNEHMTPYNKSKSI